MSAGIDVLRPRLHERAPLFQQVSSVIRSFDLVRDSVSERALGKVARVAVFARPIPKAGTEAVSGCEAATRIALGFDAAEQSSQRHVAQHFFSGRREDQGLMRLVLFQQLD